MEALVDEVVLLEVVEVVDLLRVLDVDDLVEVEVEDLVEEELTGLGLGPLMLEIPLFCKVVGNKGWISFSQTVVYIPGLPSAAKLPGSREPHCFESVQHALLVPQKGPAAQAVQPMYTSFWAM